MKSTNNMNILKKISLILTLALFLGTMSCSNNSDDGDDGNPTGFCNQLLTMSTEYSTALSNFQSNPSEESCNNLRNTALDFIDAVGDCAQFTEQYEDLEDAAQGWTDLDCAQDFE